jgi:hypothetical protein
VDAGNDTTAADRDAVLSPWTTCWRCWGRHLSPKRQRAAQRRGGSPSKNGNSTAFALWDPAELGYVATAAASQLAAGKITAAEGQVIDAGAAGKYTVGKDGEVQYNKPLMFTKDNIDDFDY